MPQATICVWALAADNEADARHLLRTREHWRVGFEQGLREPLISPEEAKTHEYTIAQRATIESVRSKALVGTGEQVAEKLSALAQDFDLDELVIVTWTYDPAPRHRSYQLLSEAFSLA